VDNGNFSVSALGFKPLPEDSLLVLNLQVTCVSYMLITLNGRLMLPKHDQKASGDVIRLLI